MRKLYKWTWRHGKLNCLFVGNVSDLYATKLCSSISISFQNNLSIFCSSMNTFREIKLSNGVFATCEFVSFPSTPLLWQDSNDSIQNIYIKWKTKTTLKIKFVRLLVSFSGIAIFKQNKEILAIHKIYLRLIIIISIDTHIV